MLPFITIFGKDISMYGICALVGILAWGIFSVNKAKKSGLDDTETIVALLICGVGGLAGSHLLYAITNIHLFIEIMNVPGAVKDFNDFLTLLGYVFGGGVFYGGMLMAILFCIIYLKIRKLDVPAYTDVIIIGLPLFHGFARIGCFLAGCCYGIEWAHGITYHQGVSPGANGVPRLPVQLIESGINFLIFFLLWYLYNHEKFKGKLTYVYLAIYSVVRFILEFFRGDAIRGRLWIFSTSQWISIAIFIFVVITAFRKRSAQKEETTSG